VSGQILSVLWVTKVVNALLPKSLLIFLQVNAKINPSDHSGGVFVRLALCDDNWGQLRILEDNAKGCEYWIGVELVIEKFTSGAELLNAVRSGIKYEYIFLDIEMPGLSGFDIYPELCTLCDSPIIFVSTHIKLLPEAFALRAHGFLAKPYNQDTFDRTVKSVVEQKVEAQFFHYTYDGKKETILCSNIVLFVIKDYVLIMHLMDGKAVILSRKNLDEVEYELSQYGFYRCNRSTLVNLRYCSGRKENSLMIRQNSSHYKDIEISRRKLREFDKQLILFRMGDKNAF